MCCCSALVLFWFAGYADHRDLHVLTHAFPTLRSSDLRVVEEYPGFVENGQRRPPGESLFETMKNIGQHRGNDAGLSHQRLCLETLHVGNGEVVLGRIEQPTEWAFQRVGRDRRA